MKQLVKAILQSLGLLKAGRVVYSFIKGASPRALWTELRVRTLHSGSIPVPPERLIFFVIGHRWAHTFLESGRTIVTAMISHLHNAGVDIAAAHQILDFGCGCGRMIRHLPEYTSARLFGCDYNAELVEWDQKNLAFADFKRNSLDPPLPYPDASFDLVYARSVFTHLTEELQVRWMEELGRVLRPDGIVYFTTHGRQFFNKLSHADRAKVEAGSAVVHEASEEGHNVCASFELDAYVRTKLTTGFQVLGYFPGIAQTHLGQDAYVLRKL